MNNPVSRRRLQRGMTLVEVTMALSVAAVLTGLAAPSFDKALQRRHLEGAAAQLATDIHYTRSLAVSRNAPLRISFEASTSGSCYVIHSGVANQCSCNAVGVPVCRDGAVAERSVHFAAGETLSLKANVRSVLFDPVRGTSTPSATLQLTSRDAGAIRQVINITGRVRSCAPAAALAGYKAC